MADRRLQVFHAVAKHLSFTKAAEALFMTQPAVTFQIKQLEEHCNTRLFDRGHGRISLTPSGEVVLEYAERILSLSAELETRLKEMTGEIAGVLLIGASTTIAEYLLPQVLGEFSSRYPKVLPRLFVSNSEIVEHRVAEHTLDIGFIESPSHLASVASDLCCEDELQVGMELGSPEALKGLVATGLGFAIMSRATVERDARLGEVVAVPLAPPLIRALSVVYPREKFRSRLADTFIEFARQRLKTAAAA